jgi:hypothetical protein
LTDHDGEALAEFTGRDQVGVQVYGGEIDTGVRDRRDSLGLHQPGGKDERLTALACGQRRYRSVNPSGDGVSRPIPASSRALELTHAA